jgi:hypothetical protein
MTQENRLPLQDEVHRINYQAVNPTMTVQQQESFRQKLLVHHVEFEGVRLSAGGDVREIKNMIRIVAAGNPSFARYARWRLTKGDQPLPLSFP